MLIYVYVNKFGNHTIEKTGLVLSRHRSNTINIFHAQI